jgi:hypothetical protein
MGGQWGQTPRTNNPPRPVTFTCCFEKNAKRHSVVNGKLSTGRQGTSFKDISRWKKLED